MSSGFAINVATKMHSALLRHKLLIALCLVLGCMGFRQAEGQIHFAQLTDPHLFDPGDEATNEYVLQWCINSINSNVQRNVQYNFIVFTGDIGIENIGHGTSAKRGPSDKEMSNAVERLASFLSDCLVKRCYFVPGNNDLIAEDPLSIGYYRSFIQALGNRLSGNGFVIRDLAPRDGDTTSGRIDERFAASEPAFLSVIGFDDASFKANNLKNDALKFEPAQLEQIRRVQNLLPSNNDSNCIGACIFYHIPEIEDPYYASLAADNTNLIENEQKRGDLATRYPRSAWTVTQNARDAWEKVVTNKSVIGLFAGHFHSANRSVYEGFGWMLNPSNYSGSVPKLFVAPPIAIKKQEDKPMPARGYREVWINKGTPALIQTKVLFYDPPFAESPPSLLQKDRPNLMVSLLIVPCIVLTVLGCFAVLWTWVYKQSRLGVSGSTYNTMLMLSASVTAVLMGLAALGLLAQCPGKDTCRFLGVSGLWALGALVVGGSLGILFGIPRTTGVEKDGAARPKTLLEEIADWLSKLIVGGSLFESNRIIGFLKSAGQYFAETVSCPASCVWAGVGSALLVYFAIVGFFSAYFIVRLYLARALDEADGRSVVSDRTGLPKPKLDALEDASLSVESVGSNSFEKTFGPIAQEAATEISAIPLESLTNWRDIRLWAKAKLSRGEIDAALNAYQRAVEIVPFDAETRLGYATALSLKKSSTQLILQNLEAAHDSIMKKTSRELRKNIFKSLTYQCLYLRPPHGFLKALAYAREYFDDPDHIESGGLWVNIACAYGQAYKSITSGDESISRHPEGLVVESKRQVSQRDMDFISWVRTLALTAVKTAISRDPDWKDKLKELMGAGPKTEDDDLSIFKDDNDFRALAGLDPVQKRQK